MATIQSRNRLALGVLLVLIGLVFLLDNLRLIPYELSYFLLSWKTLLIALGVIFLVGKKNKTSGYILILVGGFFLLPDILDVSYYRWKSYWPVLLIALGILIIYRQRLKKPFRRSGDEDQADLIDDMMLLGGGERKVASQNFRGGKVTAILGGSEYDFSQAKLAEERCEIEVFFFMGGCNFTIPEDWTVTTEVTSILGGFSDKRKIDAAKIPDPRKVIHFKGLALLGGGELRTG